MSKFDELMNEAKGLVAAGKSGQLSDEQAARMESIKGDIVKAKAHEKAIADGEALVKSMSEADPEVRPDEVGAKSLGDHFVKSLKGRSLKTPGTIATPEFKAATDTQLVGRNGGAYGPLVTDIDTEFVKPVRQRLVIADLLGGGNVSGNAISYPVYGALEGGTGAVGEGGQKPQMHVADPTWVTDALGEVAGWFKISDDMAEDLPYVVSEVNSTALYDLASKEEAALLSGNGTSPNLRGLLNRVGVQVEASADKTDNADAIFRAMTKVGLGSIFSADGIVINPLDYQALRLRKDGNGQYFGGGFFAGQYGQGGIIEQPPLWGLRTVVTNAVAAGTVLVGAFTSAKVFRKGGVRVESTNSHADDFTNDKITIRVRERLGLQVKYPAAFVKVTLSAAEPTP
ncbi:phage major capsid protein, HK97 family [Arthrobacter alpinus]|uniref:Phage major capsid protein, HK97 family n=1 Tax=Arthrobacter alpinus TaxID=656366 RepID=A0A1H5M048_9MICC|nr:phage major capsid protein [Arthrobacter alpinus]SEE82636.1 phage major capsid protein, HK97 family [Arthrobacter alpinus]